MEVKVCIGDYCQINGSEAVITQLKDLFKAEGISQDIQLKGSFCMRRCTEPGVTVEIDGNPYKVMPDRTQDFFDSAIKERLLT